MKLTRRPKLDGVRVGHLRALGRFFRDPQASTLGKLLVLLAVVYVVSPIDAIPDVAPVIGWLDDLGVIAAALTYLGRVLERYRLPVIEATARTVPASYGPPTR